MTTSDAKTVTSKTGRLRKWQLLAISFALFLLPVLLLYFSYVRLSVSDIYRFSIIGSNFSVDLKSDKTSKIIGILKKGYRGKWSSYYYKGSYSLSAYSRQGSLVEQFEYWPEQGVFRVRKNKKDGGGNVFFSAMQRNIARHLTDADNKRLRSLLGIKPSSLPRPK